jgi:MoxR-like ATPase
VQQVIDSLSEARELMWRFDAVERLAAAQLAGALKESLEEVEVRLDIERFLRPGPLWWAFDWEDATIQANKAYQTPRGEVVAPAQWEGGDPNNGCVILIDEIDKGETEVANGLLEALGTGQFTPFGRIKPVIARRDRPPPLIVITTNEERMLPDAFVRRCLVLRLRLPAEPEALAALLENRGRAHFPAVDQAVLASAARLLVKHRAEANSANRQPLPGQAEYLDLVRAVINLAPGDRDRQLASLNEIASFTLMKHVDTE